MMVYARNREHLLHLPEAMRDRVRTLMNDCALKKVEIATKLARLSEMMNLANQIQAEGRPPEAEHLRQQAGDGPLKEAHSAADKLAIVARDAPGLIQDLSKVK
jgi:hypothetical protein